MENLAILIMLTAMAGGLASITGLIKGDTRLWKINSRKRSGVALLAFLILFVIGGLMLPPEKNTGIPGATKTNPPQSALESQLTSGKLIVHYIDVGQGDATLLQGPDFTVLIDAGRHDRSEVVPYLKSAGIVEIDLLVGTHPHADHIGQMDKVLQEFPVREVWMSGGTATTRTFERVLDAILASDANYHEPRAGEKYQIGSLKIEVLHPVELTGNLNDDSISLRIQYGEIAFIFTGDVEKKGEQAMVDSKQNLQGHILQLGHHGSNTSSIPAFLKAVGPEAAIYSAGKGNPYGHPHREVIKRLERLRIKVYGTDINGTIKVMTDGNFYEIITAK
jgi:beta-lactamase superfamily II metal-dependent hydrolase